jgi:hypothetical protein
MEIYCAHCKRKTPTKNLKIENMVTHSKTGKATPRKMAEGDCTICGTRKHQFVASDMHTSKAKEHHKMKHHKEHHTMRHRK